MLNVVSGLRYTRVSADILFDMRLEMYRHLQRLSPRFYARTRLGDIMSRINNDIGEIQRIAAETALAWVGNVLFLVGTIVMLAWLDVRLFLVTIATAPLGLWALAPLPPAARSRGCDAAPAQRRHRQLPDRNAAGDEAGRRVERAGARGRALPRPQRRVHRRADVDAAADLPVGRTARPDPRRRAPVLVFVYGGYRVIHGDITVGTFVAFMAYQMRFLPPLQALMGLYANLATVRVSLRRVAQILDEPVEVQRSARRRSRCRPCAATSRSTM